MSTAIRKTRALIWEEIRVGGVVVATLTLLGILGILTGYFGNRWYFEREPLMRYTYVVGPCLAAAILLILNPNYSGHLGGGFSERIMRLPISTRTAVTVSFLCRTIFIAVSSTILIGLYNAIAEPPVAWSMIAVVTTAYTVFQFIDWGRVGKPLYVGVFFALALIIFLLLWYSFDYADRRYIAQVVGDIQNAGWLSLALVLPMYLGSRMVVERARSGREFVRLRLTFPNLDEFMAKRVDFALPVAAQTWLHRKRGHSLVVWMFILWGIIAIATNLYLETWKTSIQLGEIVTSFAWIASTVGYVSLIIIATVYGARARVIGIRPHAGHAGYDLLLPCSASDLAILHPGS